jgi:hypothetical protein
VDKHTRNREQTLLKGALKTLLDHGLTVDHAQEPNHGPGRADALLHITFGREKTTYVAEVKRGLRPATLGAVIHQLEQFKKPPILVADYVTPQMAETLRARNIPFVDTAGNAYLKQGTFLIWIEGRRPRTEAHAAGVGGRAFQASGLRVLFALICDPKLADAPYREIARQARVAHGTVGWVMAELPAAGFLATQGRRRILHNRERLLQLWAEHYPRVLRPKLQLGRYRARDFDWWTTFDPTKYGAEFGGEIAGGRITNYLRPGTATLYVEKIDPRLLIDLKLQIDAREGNVEMLQRFWTQPGPQPGIVPLPLVYADLMATGNARCIETAKLVHEQYFKGND